jgi:hypothetical protein
VELYPNEDAFICEASASRNDKRAKVVHIKIKDRKVMVFFVMKLKFRINETWGKTNASL